MCDPAQMAPNSSSSIRPMVRVGQRSTIGGWRPHCREPRESYRTHNQLPFSDIVVTSDDDDDGAEPTRVEFVIDGVTWSCDLESYECTRGGAANEEARDEVKSPDGRLAAFLRGGNLFVRETGSGDERQLTDDAEPYYGYGTLPGGRQSEVTDKLLGTPLKPGVAWSPDSTRLLTYRLDERNIKPMYLLQTAVPANDVRPILHEYRYPLPGDEHVEVAQPVVIDAETGQQVWGKGEAIVSVLHNPVDLNLLWWSKDGRSYFVDSRLARPAQSVRLGRGRQVGRRARDPC